MESKEPEFMLTHIDETNISAFAPFFSNNALTSFYRGNVLAIGAIVDDCACGAVAMNVDDGQAHILSVHVAPVFRRKAIGSWLLAEAIDSADALGDIYSIDADWRHTDELSTFFKENGFTEQIQDAFEWTILVSQLTECKVFNDKLQKFPITPLSGLSMEQLGIMQVTLDSGGLNPFGVRFADSDSAEPHISMSVWEQKTLKSVIAFSRSLTAGNELIVSAFYVADQNINRLKYLFYRAVESIIHRYSPEFVIRIPLTEKSSINFAKSIIGDIGQKDKKLCRWTYMYDEAQDED